VFSLSFIRAAELGMILLKAQIEDHPRLVRDHRVAVILVTLGLIRLSCKCSERQDQAQQHREHCTDCRNCPFSDHERLSMFHQSFEIRCCKSNRSHFSIHND